jgi:hypothetical protein
MKFSCILNCKEGKKNVVYVNSGRVIVVVSNLKIESNYGGNSP